MGPPLLRWRWRPSLWKVRCSRRRRCASFSSARSPLTSWHPGMADGCSILAFTRIKGLYDATNATDVANVIVTLVSIVFVLFLQLK